MDYYGIKDKCCKKKGNIQCYGFGYDQCGVCKRLFKILISQKGKTE